MYIALIQEVVQADAIGILLFALLLSPVVIPAIVKKSKMNEAEEIKRRYPEGVRKIIGWMSQSIDYDTAKKIVRNEEAIASAQRDFDEKKVADGLRRECPNACSGKTDTYIANHKDLIRSEERRFVQRKEEAKTILLQYKEGATAICGSISSYSLSESDINNLITNKSKIQAEQQKINENTAEVARLSPPLKDLRKEFPLAVRAVIREKGWSMLKAEDIQSLLRLSSSMRERQIVEEYKIINNKTRFGQIVSDAKKDADSEGKAVVKRRITRIYGQVISSKVTEILDADEHFALLASFMENLQKTQNDFAQETRNMISQNFSGWGWYNYNFEYGYNDGLGRSKTIKMKVWQPFCESCCFDDSISYEYYPRIKENRISKTHLEDTYFYNEKPWDKVKSFILNLKEKYSEELFVILANTDGLSDSSFKNNFNYIERILSEEEVNYGYSISDDTSNSKNKKYIVIDLITENKNLVEFCEEIFTERYGDRIRESQGSTGIVFITMLKCYDGVEVEALNKKAAKEKEEKENKAREEEERRQREEAQKRQDAADILSAQNIARRYPVGYKCYFQDLSPISLNASQARAILQKEESIKAHESAVENIEKKVINWDTVCGVPHYFFYYYYPTRFTNISIDSQAARRLVYNFKDGVDHQRVKVLVVNKLRETFSAAELSKLTFVCIPASTRAVHKARNENFSFEVSQELKMLDGYDYITIIKEKTPSHLGGTDSAEYAYDSSFFKGKLVVLFDDIVTRGGSISSMKSNLESLGATVICAISIGRTFSDWNGQQPKPHPYTGRI